MKSRFSTIDIASIIKELIGFLCMRVINVYDIDNKTYLIKLGKQEDKATILIESGIRIHSTEFDWPKNPAPSGFSMKMRKHIRGRRLECVTQLGVDRMVDLQFGSGEAAYHVIVELYDRGNIVLTDFEYLILNILRPRTDNSQDVRFAVRETYPIASAKEHEIPTEERLREIILGAKEDDSLKKVLIPQLDYGPALIENCLIGARFANNVKIGKGFNLANDISRLMSALNEAEELFVKLQSQPSKGYIIQKAEKKPIAKQGEEEQLLIYDEFHPMMFRQNEKQRYVEFDTFNKAVDEFFSKMESQKLDTKALQQEKAALKKLENIKKDHEKRVQELQKEQDVDKLKGQLIEMNLQLVDHALLIVRSGIANQLDWTEIKSIIKEATMDGDPVATAIKDLKFNTNHMTMLLKNPYMCSDEEDNDDDERIKPMKVDIDLSLSAYANSRKYFEKKKQASHKEQKTIDASAKALKSAERKTMEALKEVATAVSINKARKTYWFEKFLWFISSENYLVIGGRDSQQNEIIVKKHLRPGDLYVHADLHGASSCIIKNPTGESVPPKTLNEAGTMAICNSAAWDAKVVTSAWWVYHDQVSKTAPSGEYLTTGSFMIRGKKNYLPPSYLVYGFAIMFKLEDGSIVRHAGERRVRTADEDEMSVADSMAAESEATIETNSDNEMDNGDDSINEDKSDEDDDDKVCDEDCDGKLENRNAINDQDSQKDESENDNLEADDTEEDSLQTRTKISRDLNMLEEQSQKDQDGKTNSGREEVDMAFPDTMINLQHVKGDKFELSRSHADSSRTSESEPFYLGDDMPVTFGEKPANTKAKLSAKQRREMKKALKAQQQHDVDNDESEKVQVSKSSLELEHEQQGRGEERRKEENVEPIDQQQQQQQKRGHKGKLKKMKEKYKDQDEEERNLRMEILASAGLKKEDKKKGKKNKDKVKGHNPFGSDKGRPQSGMGQSKGGKGPQQVGKGLAQNYGRKLELVDIVIKDVEDIKIENGEHRAEDVASISINMKGEKEVEDDKEEEDLQTTSEDKKILDSLSGIPHPDDELLYAVPVCAPYTCLTHYKYKAKLLPGSTKKGKAAKIALNMFVHDKQASSREKDLLKILKDIDISRNFPGKVKVAAANLHKQKRH
ncbi:hypothetical protein CHS0354_042701 [Potamilus streckersoni]|uniref:Nuclear export mediator factor NEMF n=1 Tax=Potamilus streckersoni TaxID=2493646 RepID=A0AAE0VRV4_9BIVA|nr:hypothetical protein CHS0354_042701 [Potamilus streckersoni]